VTPSIVSPTPIVIGGVPSIETSADDPGDTPTTWMSTAAAALEIALAKTSAAIASARAGDGVGG
jgi:hypothetical protein